MAAYRLLACIMLGWRLIVSILPILCYFVPLYARRKLLWSSWRVTNPLFKFLEFAAIVKERVPSAIVIVDNDKPISTKADATNHLSGHHDSTKVILLCRNVSAMLSKLANCIHNQCSRKWTLAYWFSLTPLWHQGACTSHESPTKHSISHCQISTLPQVSCNYSGLDGYPGREIHAQITDRSGAVLSFGLGANCLWKYCCWCEARNIFRPKNR